MLRAIRTECGQNLLVMERAIPSDSFASRAFCVGTVGIIPGFFGKLGPKYWLSTHKKPGFFT